MSRKLFAIEKGLRIYGENSSVNIDVLTGTGLPSTSDTDTAEIGSLYLQDNGQLYQKVTAGSGSDKWKRKATVDDISSIRFRSEKVVAVTSTTAPTSGDSIDLSINPLGLDETPFLDGSDFDTESYIVFGFGATLKMMHVTNVTGDVITVEDIEDPLSNGDNFIVQYYLPDISDSQEKQALIQYNNNQLIKISDFNWSLADGISLNGSIVDRNGPVIGTDTVQVGIEKLEGDSKDLVSLSGLSRGAINNGTFTGKTILDNRTTKEALQDLETAIESRSQVSGITTETTLDSVSVDVIKCVKWLVHVYESATPGNVKALEVFALHNGTNAADATSVDDTASAILKFGSNFNLSVVVDLSGTGASQVMRLRIASTTSGVVATARRLEVY